MEWFLFQLVVSLKKFVWERREFTAEEIYITDDFFYDLNHNPYLVLLHRYLDRLSMQPDQEVKNKLCFIVREYFVRDVVKQQPNNSQLGMMYAANVRGRRAHHMEAVHLLIFYCLNSTVLQPAEMEQFFKICLRSGPSSDPQLTDVLRVWMYYIRPSDRIEVQVVGIAANNQKTEPRDRKYKIKQYESEWLVEKS